ncbi:hypothetical protein [Streptomyces sp. NPDC060027]|uniref:hypothetical protein n=1 Tax=Streptomyces sp. NPDC060027 TaxID=3347040 RepID=UPI003698147F
MAELAHWRSFLARDEDDLSPVLAVVADESFYKYGPDMTEEQEAGFREGTLEVYGVGVLRPYASPHRRRGQFYVDEMTFTWGTVCRRLDRTESGAPWTDAEPAEAWEACDTTARLNCRSDPEPRHAENRRAVFEAVNRLLWRAQW